MKEHKGTQNNCAKHRPALRGPTDDLSDIRNAASLTGIKSMMDFCIFMQAAQDCSIPTDLSILRKNNRYIRNFYNISSSLQRYAAATGNKQFSFQDDMSMSEKRLRTTLNRLKAKSEVYADNIPDLLKNILYETNIAFALTLACVEDIEQILRLSSSHPERYVIKDTTWYKAIEIVIAQHEADGIDGDIQNFAGLLRPYYKELMIYTFILNFISTPELEPEAKAPETVRCEDTVCHEPAPDEETRQQDGARIEELEGEVRTLTNQLQTTTDALSDASNKLRKLLKESTHYQNKNASMEKELSELREENEFLEALLLEYAAQETLSDDEEYPVPSEAEPEGDVLDGIALPSKNVVFLGGHINLVNKVKAIHPDWKYINPTDRPGRHLTMFKCELVFFWSNHISHSMDKSFFSKNNIPCVYVTATNIDKLEREMKHGYSEFKRKEAVNREEGKQPKNK